MDRVLLKSLLIMVARRCAQRQYKYQILDKKRLGEAEVRNVMAKTLEEKQILYGIEVQTSTPYQKTTNNYTRRALFDLIIYDDKDDSPSVLIEFKRGQTPIGNIEKDFRKMKIEPKEGIGTCFFHVLP